MSLVYQIQKKSIKYVKTKVENLENVIYFSDGCAAQNKKSKEHLDLCCHSLDFSKTVEWVFFAISHGKSVCDSIGGTIKPSMSL